MQRDAGLGGVGNGLEVTGVGESELEPRRHGDGVGAAVLSWTTTRKVWKGVRSARGMPAREVQVGAVPGSPRLAKVVGPATQAAGTGSAGEGGPGRGAAGADGSGAGEAISEGVAVAVAGIRGSAPPWARGRGGRRCRAPQWPTSWSWRSGVGDVLGAKARRRAGAEHQGGDRDGRKGSRPATPAKCGVAGGPRCASWFPSSGCRSVLK